MFVSEISITDSVFYARGHAGEGLVFVKMGEVGEIKSANSGSLAARVLELSYILVVSLTQISKF